MRMSDAELRRYIYYDSISDVYYSLRLLSKKTIKRISKLLKQYEYVWNDYFNTHEWRLKGGKYE